MVCRLRSRHRRRWRRRYRPLSTGCLLTAAVKIFRLPCDNRKHTGSHYTLTLSAAALGVESSDAGNGLTQPREVCRRKWERRKLIDLMLSRSQMPADGLAGLVDSKLVLEIVQLNCSPCCADLCLQVRVPAIALLVEALQSSRMARPDCLLLLFPQSTRDTEALPSSLSLAPTL